MCALLAGIVIKETPDKWPWGPYTEEDEMSDIVERLRTLALSGVLQTKDEARTVLEAADTIERLKEECEIQRQGAGAFAESFVKAQQNIREMVAELARLRSIAGKADVGQSFAEVTSELRHPASGLPLI